MLKKFSLSRPITLKAKKKSLTIVIDMSCGAMSLEVTTLRKGAQSKNCYSDYQFSEAVPF